MSQLPFFSSIPQEDASGSIHEGCLHTTAETRGTATHDLFIDRFLK
jgi:hypothetical protein